MSDFSSALLQNIKIQMFTWTIESVCVLDYDSKEHERWIVFVAMVSYFFNIVMYTRAASWLRTQAAKESYFHEIVTL